MKTPVNMFQSSPMPVAAEFEAVLRHHVIDVWFPRSLDRDYGGFLCDFDYRWKPCGQNEKLLEFQARQTWFAAEASQIYPKDERLRQAVEHGFSYLRGALWDEVQGGWFHRLDRAGRPIEEHTKHTHGFAYAIIACIAVHEATGDKAALHLAREGFDWIYRYARDGRHGGYFGYLRRDGSVIRDGDVNHWNDTINSPLDCKDISVHSGLLETFTYLYAAWPEPKAADQLAEILDIVCNRMASPLGAHHQYCLADWTPVPHLTRFGHQFYDAFRVLGGARLLGDKEQILVAARRFADHALRYGWDRHRGGFYFAGPGLEPLRLQGQNLMLRKKLLWVQMGALKALLAIHGVAPDEERYLLWFKTQWSYIQNYLVDAAYGGFHPVSLERLPWWRKARRLAPASMTRKGSDWKDSSHDGRALLYCMSFLRARELAQPPRSTNIPSSSPSLP
jgi:mannobiose 2-epimerase